MTRRSRRLAFALVATLCSCKGDDADMAPGTGASTVGTSAGPTTDATTLGTTGTATGAAATSDAPTSADASSGGVDVDMVSSVSQYGITWTFDQPYPAGQFVTGDWWVVGPLTIVQIDPAPTGERNGSMLDPVGTQAYDARGGEYDGSKGVTVPLTIEADHSLVSSISHPEEPECDQGGTPGWQTYDGDCQRGPIHTQAVLTILGAVPTELTFRPPYSGTAKPMHPVSSVCWDGLPSLAAPGDLPEATTLLRHVERPWIDHLGSWTMQHGCATHNMYCYGREIGNIVSILGAYAILDAPQHEDVATRLVQLGIDNYGVIQAGGGWGFDGGHFNGRKFPIVFAGALLGDAGMSSPGTEIGNEDAMTYFNDSGVALWGGDCDNCYFGNGCMNDGNCPSGAKDCRDPDHQVDGCEDYRNCCTSVTWVGESLAIRLMGEQAAWGHDAFFAYVERWMDGDVPGGGETSASFVSELWTMHAQTPPLQSTCP